MPHLRRSLIPALAVVLAAAACGDDDAATTTVAPTTTTAAATTSTAPPASTTTMATTTTVAPTTTTTPLDPAAARIAAAQALMGAYEGTWTNTTFGSTGSIMVNVVEVNETAGYALVQIDLGGNVFGASDPDLFVAEFDLLVDPPYDTYISLFGNVTIDVTEDGLSITAPDVPGVGLPMTLEVTFTADGFEGTYTIEGLAEGVFEATRTG